MATNTDAAAPKLTRFDFPAWSLVLANLIPLIGAIFFGWETGIILIIYWAENLVVGFYAIFRIILSSAPHPSEHLAKFFIVPFFLIHFGGFCAIHGAFVLSFAGADTQLNLFSDIPFIGLLVNVIQTVWLVYFDSIWISVVALFISHGVSFVKNYLIGGEYLRHSSKLLMITPYGRIVLMHIAIIAASLPVMLFGSPLPLLVVLVAFKIVVDLLFHYASHHGGIRWSTRNA